MHQVALEFESPGVFGVEKAVRNLVQHTTSKCISNCAPRSQKGISYSAALTVVETHHALNSEMERLGARYRFSARVVPL